MPTLPAISPNLPAGIWRITRCSAGQNLRAVCHRAAKGEPVEVQHLQLTGLCSEHGAGAPGSSAGNATAGSGSLLLAELAGGKAAGDRGKRSGYSGARADRPAAYRRFCRGTGRKTEPDRGAAASKNEMLSRRDNARTQWIAGVSHDVRTPLALILGWAEQLEQDALLPDSSRQKATGIRTQCEKLRTLIDDLNLTSKLEYGAQPLRRKDLRAGPLFRQLVAQFCESPLAERCEITLEQEEPAEQTELSVDEALLARLLENLLNNSVRHNPKPVNITVHTRRAGERFCLTVADDGIGYPAAVLAALNAAEPAENAPHILGLYVVQQIAAAHGGRAVFAEHPHGAKAVVYLPLG